ncbi:MAG: hypothetical protein Q7R81_05810 [Candidatus Peregrinibacteria bacterium]|nr:hypothetical protein [Candidatus Peregrinibacteria bacterium]
MRNPHPPRVFTLSLFFLGLLTVLVLQASARFGGAAVHMNANAMYSPAPMYGDLKLNASSESNSRSSARKRAYRSTRSVKKIGSAVRKALNRKGNTRQRR